MALLKPIRQDDGVIANYHRILFVQQTINRQISIAVISYIDKESRDNEATATTPPYRRSKTFEAPYDENVTPAKAYDLLKTLPEFEGAEDV